MEEPTNQDIGQQNSFWLFNGELRVIWKLLVFFAVFVSSMLVLSLLFFFLPVNLTNPFIGGFIGLVSVVIATSTTVILIEKRNFTAIGLPVSGNWLKVLGTGIGISSTMILCIALIEISTGMCSIRVSVVTIGQGASVFFKGALVFIIVGVTEELMTRGYPMQTLAHRLKKTHAALLIAAVFTAMHIGNPNVTWLALLNIYLAGIWLGAAYFLSESLWLPVGLHIGWNFTQSTILGFPVSGLVENGVCTVVTGGPAWMSGGSFGPEGGALATVVLSAGTFLLFHPKMRSFIRIRTGLSAPPLPSETTD
jgi:uncharacterized protein